MKIGDLIKFKDGRTATVQDYDKEYWYVVDNYGNEVKIRIPEEDTVKTQIYKLIVSYINNSEYLDLTSEDTEIECVFNDKLIDLARESMKPVLDEMILVFTVTGDKEEKLFPLTTPVSMNMWGFTPEFIDELDGRFVDFLSKVEPGNLKAEYLLPEIVGDLLAEGKATVEVLETMDKWFGITYKEDTPYVKEFFKRLADEKVYPAPLWQ